ncbi:acylneuraminate cytidylyltransferase family protein [Luminiphilus sp.]|nr:acylneuraminate cytidylyltransferase family protein [Luminiphilus sp.]
MKTVAFIFCRGGSKGLPGKNIKSLNGKPLLQYSIDTAKEVPEISDIFVSTDCNSIAAVARAHGVEVIERPGELATDNSSEWLSWRHAIDHVTEHFGGFERFVSLPATSPLRNESDVQATLDKLSSSDADICITVTPANRSPYFNMVRLQADGSVEVVIEPKGAVSRRQDAPTVFDITTVAYAATVPFIQQNSSIFAGKVVATVVPKDRAVDIDDIYDFMFAEALLKSESYDA